MKKKYIITIDATKDEVNFNLVKSKLSLIVKEIRDACRVDIRLEEASAE